MSEESAVSSPAPTPVAEPTPPPPPWWREITQPFVDLAHAPRALWGVNLSYLIEGLCYFGWLTLLAIYFNQHVGLNDIHAGWMVAVLTGGITLAMLFLGGLSDRWGVRRAILLALSAMLIGRLIMVSNGLSFVAGSGAFESFGSFVKAVSGIGAAEGEAVNWPLYTSAVLGLLFIILGYGLYQPAAYSAVRQFTDEKSSAMAYAMLYALMNLGGFLPGLLSPPVRRAHGIPGVYWVYVGLTAVGLLAFAVILTRRVQQQAIEAAKRSREQSGSAPAKEAAAPAKAEPAAGGVREPFSRRVWSWLKNHPLHDAKFSYFIFCLIPVQTLFAHNWLTLPQYVDRALGQVGHDYMEFFVNLNPILIFVLAPMVAAFTRKRKVYNMMIAGTFVMAAPTFLLALAPSIWLLLAYLIIMSVGEAMWQPRFLQYAAEIAPPGRTGAYMGVAQLPWFLTKIITAMYSGWFLMRYCPAEGEQNTTFMWLVYACIAMMSTVMLFLARNWVGKGFKTKSA